MNPCMYSFSAILMVSLALIRSLREPSFSRVYGGVVVGVDYSVCVCTCVYIICVKVYVCVCVCVCMCVYMCACLMLYMAYYVVRGVALTTVSIGRGLHLLRGVLVVPRTCAVGSWDEGERGRRGKAPLTGSTTTVLPIYLHTLLIQHQAHRVVEDSPPAKTRSTESHNHSRLNECTAMGKGYSRLQGWLHAVR